MKPKNFLLACALCGLFLAASPRAEATQIPPEVQAEFDRLIEIEAGDILDQYLSSLPEDIREALAAMAGCENLCPVCGRQMLGSRWFAQPGHRYMDLATCADHGKFLIRVRLSAQPDGTIRVSRLTYEATSEAAEAYARRAQKAEPEAPRRSRRRRRRTGTKKEAEQS